MKRSDLLVDVPLGDWIDSIVRWMISAWDGFFGVIETILLGFHSVFSMILTTPPFWVILLVLIGLAFLAKGWKLALGSALGLILFVYGVGQWENAMHSLALVLVASLVAIILGVPLGILAARHKAVSVFVRPILDFLQTMPAFVYLIPFAMIFSLGVVPGIVATIFFAIAPAVRFTELGIRQVDSSVVEAAYAFGAHPRRVLYQVQLPLALPTIMAGINQVIMLSLSMVVIAGMVGAGGLGADVVQAIQRVNISLGAEAGTATVVLAMYLDRVTGAFGAKRRRNADD
ncbi:MAG: ABC transporter permease [Gleimia sp.]|jgi:glycine betaine/proline transport system substrate-binding protein|nr:ABC transporter permease subunit [Acidobacteriota bacterium]